MLKDTLNLGSGWIGMIYRGFIIRKDPRFTIKVEYNWWLDGQKSQDKIISGTGLSIEDCKQKVDKAIKEF